jgi:multiple sugar transport system substrate-binding protein
MKARRRLAALTVVLTAAGALAACGGDQANSSSAGSGKGGPITVWVGGDDPGKFTDKQKEFYLASKSDAKIDLVKVPRDDIGNKLLSQGATRSGPDVVWYNGAFTPAAAEGGVLYDMTDKLNAYADKDKFLSGGITSVDGKVYGIKAYANLIALWYNKDILDEYGIAVPKTWDEFQAACAKIKAGGKYTPFIMSSNGAVDGDWHIKPFLTSYGVKNYKELNKPEVLQVFQLLKSMVDKGYIDKQLFGKSATEQLPSFTGGKAAFFIGGNWMISTAKKDAKFTWGSTTMPAGPAGPAVVYVGGETESIGAFAKDPDAAWDYLVGSWFAKDYQQKVFDETGGIPIRTDVTLDTNATPGVIGHVEGLKTAADLSGDTTTTLALGDLVSGVMAGQITPEDAAAKAADLAAKAK